MEKKYEFTGVTQQVEGRTLHRIRAVRSFGDVKEGQLGGWIESEENLSHEGLCWVGDDAIVYERAKVFNDALVKGHAFVKGKAEVAHAAKVVDWGFVDGRAKISGFAIVYENGSVHEDAKVGEGSCVHGSATVSGKACVEGNAELAGDVEVCDKAVVKGDVRINRGVRIAGESVIQRREDYIIFDNWCSDDWDILWTRSDNMWSHPSGGAALQTTGEELIDIGYRESVKTGCFYERIVKFVRDILQGEE